MACQTTQKKTTARKKTDDQPKIIASTVEQAAPAASENADTIAIACCLPLGLVFRDIPNGKGGTTTIRLPGINSALRGASKGVLALPGNALCVVLSKADWEALVRTHGREAAFTGVNGSMPCIYPVKNMAGFESAKNSGEIAEMSSGLEAADPTASGVEAVKGSHME